MTLDNEEASLQKIDAATRKAIHDSFPMGVLMKSGANNPLTIHSADPKLFRAMYALISETLSVTCKVDRSTKEKIATLVSERNQCPVCIVAHTMMDAVASSVEHHHKKCHETQEARTDCTVTILEYAESILDALQATRQGKPPVSATEESTATSLLDAATQAEIALVVLVFDHMNRVVSAILGEELSTAMMGVPRGIAKHLEQPGLVALASKLMAGLLGGPFRATHEPGFTRKALLDGEETESEATALAENLPENLGGVARAGTERAIAVGRLLEWTQTYETERCREQKFLSEGLVKLLERPGKSRTRAETRVWEPDFQQELQQLSDPEAGSAVASLLLALSPDPRAVYQSSHWTEAVQTLGGERHARCVVLWWSLRTTLRDAAGLQATG